MKRGEVKQGTNQVFTMKTPCKTNSYIKLRVALIVALITLAASGADGQPYTNGVGIRAGYSSGVVFRHFTDKEIALEGQALYNPFGFQITGLFEYQFSPYAKERLYYYAGAGLHSGNWSDEFSVGAAVIAGTEFVFRKAPLVIGLEWKPMINFYRVFDFGPADLAITAKVSLN